MPEVWMQQLASMDSPIRHVMRHIHVAIVNIAPENKASFAKEFDGIILEYLDDHRWICNVSVAEKHVRLSRKVMEVLWTASLMYIRFLEAASEETVRTKSEAITIDFDQSPRLKEAADLYKWAMNSYVNCSNDPWPSALPRPVPEPADESDEDFAEDFSLRAATFILHHELAHIRLGHNGKSELDCERDADGAAIDWILGAIDGDRDDQIAEFTKRVVGCAIAFMVRIAKEIYTGNAGGLSHPRSYDRLMHTLDRHIQDEAHLVWDFIADVLKLHLDNAPIDIEIPVGPFKSGWECVNAYVDALSRISPQSV